MQGDGPTGTRDRADNASNTPASNPTDEAVCHALITNVETRAKCDVNSDAAVPTFTYGRAHAALTAKHIKKDSWRIAMSAAP